MKKIILILIAITALTEGCKKYEEGPCFSLRSAEKRLYGTYMLTQYAVNGIDSLALYKDSLGLNFIFGFDNGNDENICTIRGLSSDEKEVDMCCGWKLKNHNKDLDMNHLSGNSYGTGPFNKNTITEWKILRLTNSELKMKTSYNNKEYLIELKGS